jgi:hypothetical protein
MIVAISKYILLSALALAASWTAVAWTAPDWPEILARDDRAYAIAFPGTFPQSFQDRAAIVMAMIPFSLRNYLLEPGCQGLLALLSVVRIHSRVAARFLPILLLTLLSGGILGATLRERIRHGSGYASPTLAFVSKRLLVASLGYFLVWSLSPIPGAYGTLYVAPAAGFVAMAFYAANLPVRL